MSLSLAEVRSAWCCAALSAASHPATSQGLRPIDRILAENESLFLRYLASTQLWIS